MPRVRIESDKSGRLKEKTIVNYTVKVLDHVNPTNISGIIYLGPRSRGISGTFTEAKFSWEVENIKGYGVPYKVEAVLTLTRHDPHPSGRPLVVNFAVASENSIEIIPERADVIDTTPLVPVQAHQALRALSEKVHVSKLAAHSISAEDC